jgi:hypothetical protein
MQPPKIDTRDKQDLIDQMKMMAPYYTPEWRFSPEDPDPGSTLFLLFADMFHENIKRMNRVPVKNLVAFMNLFDVSLLPARPASAFLTFRLNVGMREPVLIPAGTQVAAQGEQGDILFETERALLLTPASLAAAFLTSRKHDTIMQIPESFIDASKAGLSAPTPLFQLQEGVNLQEHVLYLEHSHLFLLRETARIEIEIGHSRKPQEEPTICKQLVDPALAEWLYATENGWQPFDKVEAAGNRVILHKMQLGELVEQPLSGHSGRWIQCRMKRTADHIPTIADLGLELDRIQVKTDYVDNLNRGGIAPDIMFYNDVQADADSGFYPFGDQFSPYGTFYVSSKEALSKLDGLITLSFGLKIIANRFQTEQDQVVDWKLIMKKSRFERPNPPIVAVAQVIWEYWNGISWVRLDAGREAERLFYRPGQDLVRQQVKFRCPQDMEEAFVNSHLNYWVRARIIQIDNLYSVLPIHHSPWMEDVSLSYEYPEESTYKLHRCLTLNHTAILDQTQQSRGHAGLFQPFFHMEVEHPSLYLAFDLPPVKGPLSLFASVQPQKFTERDIPLLEWEYWRTGAFGEAPRWSPLKVLDDTNGLTRNGTVQFAGPVDFQRNTWFGHEGYWLRIINRDNKYDDFSGTTALPVLNGLYLNTIRAVQQESVTNEYPDPRVGDIASEFQLSRTPVVSETVWVDETGKMAEEEVRRHIEQGTLELDVIRDTDGYIYRLWVKWHPIAHLSDSGSEDRHYTIDRTFGRIRFGDGIHGKVPPQGGLEQIKVNYTVTRGKEGNVGAGQIASLQNSIAFVGGALNPEAAAGGCDAENQESAMRRGPQQLKHRGRAVTAKDFEWLAREAYPNIARVKCLANYNALVEPDIGCITLVILPQEGVGGLAAFPELKRHVERYVLQRASNLVALPDRIQVIQPAFLEISVTAYVAVQGIEEIVPTELEAIARLQRFLDPLSGNYDGKGWEIGQDIHLSMFYALLKSIHSINHVEKLYMAVYKLEDNVRTELNVNSLPTLLHGIIISGTHKVVVNAI